MPHYHRLSYARHCWLALAALATAAPSLADGAAADWSFQVLLDSRPIGTHRFELVATDDGMQSLISEARFEVKVLGFTAYRYHHRAEERWSGDCLRFVTARTDDDGTITTVNGEIADRGFKVISSGKNSTTQDGAPGCMVSFAYWNPRQLERQQQLLDPGTGRIEDVSITHLPATTIDVRGTPTSVTGLRINGLKAPIDVWYANERWVALDTSADGGRKLTYRLL